MKPFTQLFLYGNVVSILFLFPNSFGDTLEINRELNQNCTCVPYFQCTDDFGDLITDGAGMLDVRLLNNSSCDGYFDVCCDSSKAVIAPTTQEPQDIFNCGYQNKGLFPWYAILYFQKTQNVAPTYMCGVALIHPKAVLTAAHCINKEGIWSVQVGSASRRISNIIVHPEFNKATLHNDIALAILQDPIEISEKVNTLCIPPHGLVSDNMRCKVTTTVKNLEGHGSYPSMLKVSIVPKEICLKKLRSTRLGSFFQLHRSFLCASDDNHKKTCGDGGSPLVCSVPGQPERYQLVGVVSWGIGCRENNTPDVYVKLSMFRDWIDNKMLDHGLEISSYRY